MLVIKKLNKQTVDVFTGNGWDNWSRFDMSDRFPKLVAGVAILNEEYKELMKYHVELLRKVRTK